MKFFILYTLIALYLSGCVFTKVVTVPIRVTGAVVSVVPIIGDGVNSVLGASADVIDAIPI
jgi:hypothetical protein